MAIYILLADCAAARLAFRRLCSRNLIAFIRRGEGKEIAADRRALLVHFATLPLLPHSFCAQTTSCNLFQCGIAGQAVPTHTKIRLARMLQSRYGQ
jgi:hypothetical protein